MPSLMAFLGEFSFLGAGTRAPMKSVIVRVRGTGRQR